MAALDDFVSLVISITGQSPAQATFAVPMIAGSHTRFPELVRTYRSLAGMLADGFLVTDAEYQAASKILAQSPTVPSIKVGRLSGTQTARIVTMLATPFNLGLYTISINGTSYSFTADASATAAEIATGLAAVINADTAIPVTATVATNNLVLTADVAGPDFFFDIANEGMWASIQDTSAVRSTIAADLAAILAADSGWYAMTLTRANQLDNIAAAAFVESNKRVLLANAINFGAIVSANDCLAANITNLPGALEAAGYTRTFCAFTKHDADYFTAAVAGAVLPKTVGSWTAQAKTFAAVQPTRLSSTEQLNLENNRCNHYQEVAGLNLLQTGVMSASRFFDEIVILDWTSARIKEAIVATLASVDKIPMTEPGVGLIENAIMGVMGEGERNGAFVPGSSFVRSPAVADVSTGNRLARLFSGVEFGAQLQGAIHKVSLRGNLAA